MKGEELLCLVSSVHYFPLFSQKLLLNRLVVTEMLANWVSSVIYVTMQVLHEHMKMSNTCLIYTSWQWPGQHYYRARPASETVQSPLALWSWDRRLLSRVRVVKVSLCQEDGSWPGNGQLQFPSPIEGSCIQRGLSLVGRDDSFQDGSNILVLVHNPHKRSLFYYQRSISFQRWS